MRLKTFLLVALAVACTGVTMLAWRQWRELVALRATALSGDERAAFEARLAEFRRRNYQLQSALAALRSGPGGADAGGAAKQEAETRKSDEARLLASLAAGEAKLDSKREEDLELLAALADLPEFQRMLALQQRGKIDAKFAGLFKKMKLSPEEFTRLQGLLADRQNAYADAMLAARDQGLTGSDARRVANDVARATQKEITNSLKELLGPQRFNQLQNYERTAPQRETVDQIAQRLSYTSTPLSPRQSDQLVQLLATSGTPPPAAATNAKTAGSGRKNAVPEARPAEPVASLPGSVSGLGIGSTNTVVISNAALAQAQAFLSPQQVAVLQRLQQEQQAQQTLGNLLRNGTVTPPPKTPPAKRKG